MSYMEQITHISTVEYNEDENTKMQRDATMTTSPGITSEVVTDSDNFNKVLVQNTYEPFGIPTSPSLRETIEVLKKDHAEIRAILTNFVKSGFDRFRRYVVQLANILQEIVVLRIFPDAKIKFKSRNLTFDSVLYSEHVSLADLETFLSDPLFKRVAAFTIRSSDFLDIRGIKLWTTHPRYISLFDIENTAAKIGDGDLLVGSDNVLFERTRKVYSEMLKFDELDHLLHDYNNK